MRKLVTSLATMLAIASSNVFAANLTYLSCDISDGRHFDFTLDESNGTVTFYIKKANVTNTEKAAFGPEAITWSNNIGYSKVTRIISRVDLSFTEEFDQLGDGNIKKQTGACQIKKPQERKF
jgi:hypothetical protein